MEQFRPKWLDDLRDFFRHWSVLFTTAVIVWFAFSALSFPNINFGESDESGTAAVSATEESEPANISFSTQVEVTSFHLKQGFPLTAELTLEVHNESKSNMTFRPDSLVLRQVGGQSTAPIELETSRIEIAGGRSTIVPVTFPVNVRTGGSYELTYGGNTVFTGRPI